jgi:hypothetical protein
MLRTWALERKLRIYTLRLFAIRKRRWHTLLDSCGPTRPFFSLRLYLSMKSCLNPPSYIISANTPLSLNGSKARRHPPSRSISNDNLTLVSGSLVSNDAQPVVLLHLLGDLGGRAAKLIFGLELIVSSKHQCFRV